MKKLLAVLALLFLGIFMVSYSWAGEVRVWTSGNHTIEGEFVELIEGDSIVRIRKTNGKVVRIPLSKLSQEDQEYINDSVNPFDEEDVEPNRIAGERMVKTVYGIDYAFRWCPPGEFMMGGDEYKNEKPVHKVKITRGFWLLETEVTQLMWQSVMGQSVQQKRDKEGESWPMKGEGPGYPMYCVSWDESQEFCQKLSQKLGQRVQLPTEAQWEYACRAGTTGDYAGDLNSMAWYNEDYWGFGSSHPVAQKKPNAWGLYDMYGNVLEWCLDYYAADYYDRSPTSDPENTTASSDHVVRGGCWRSGAVDCRSGGRKAYKSDYHGILLGLRVLLVPGQD